MMVHGKFGCFGSNEYGQTELPGAFELSFENGSALVFAGGHHTCGIGLLGNAKCWGLGLDGQISVPSSPDFGNGNEVREVSINQAGFIFRIDNSNEYTWYYIALGGNHTCGIRMGGYLMCWGSNAFGQTVVKAG
mmetsp:Transcript_65191/g.55331  ORF Transcript_65191/g.55331 Transcript_65191/m.55331 type:complete len:134 (+) Transcript_65191:80-481(+)